MYNFDLNNINNEQGIHVSSIDYDLNRMYEQDEVNDIKLYFK